MLVYTVVVINTIPNTRKPPANIVTGWIVARLLPMTAYCREDNLWSWSIILSTSSGPGETMEYYIYPLHVRLFGLGFPETIRPHRSTYKQHLIKTKTPQQP
jgi:hypothetical protein